MVSRHRKVFQLALLFFDFTKPQIKPLASNVLKASDMHQLFGLSLDSPGNNSFVLRCYSRATFDVRFCYSDTFEQ